MAFATGLLTAHAASMDQNWESRFVLAPGLNGEVYAMVAMGTNLYAGGAFTKAGDIPTRGIARWDGQRWNAVGGGVDDVVFALATGGTNLYAGGRFNSAGGVAATNIARWDGTNWSNIGALYLPDTPNANWAAAVYSLILDGTDLIAGGTFFSAGGTLATNVARWDGSAWHPLGDGLGILDTFARPAAVYDLAKHGTNLFAAGVFINSGPVGTTNLARWNGASWEPVGHGVAGGAGYYLWNGETYEEYSGVAYTLCSTPTGLLVGGDFTQASGMAVTNLARWDGTNWLAMGVASAGSINGIFPDGTNYIVLGYFSQIGGISASGVAQLSGNSWTALGQGVYPLATCAARVGTDLFVGGEFQVAGGQSAGFIARWNGAELEPLLPGKSTAPRGGVSDMVIGSDGSVCIVGWFMTAGEAIANNLARYDGTNWSAFGEGFPSGLAPSYLAMLGTNLYVAGHIWQPTAGIAGIARWEGNNWVSVGGGLSRGIDPPHIQDLAVGGTNIFVAGSFDQAGGAPITNLACWDGFQWRGFGYASLEFIGAIAVRSENPSVCEISGVTDSTIRVREWDGLQWTDVGTVPTAMGYAYVNKMIWAGTNLFVGGRFVITNGFTATNLVRWDGQTWSGVDSPFGDGATILDLAWNGTSLFASGGWDFPGAPVVAKWDGANWSTLGSGIAAAPGDNPGVFALAVRGRDVYAGGQFTTAGGKPADNLALWHDFPAVTLAARGWQPNGHFGLSIHGGQGQPVQVQSSTNLATWTSLGQQLPTSDPFDFDVSPASPATQHFYRLLLLP